MISCREFEQNISYYFSKTTIEQVQAQILDPISELDWRFLDKCTLCPQLELRHLVGCGACGDSLREYFDFRDKGDYHNYPCSHLASHSLRDEEKFIEHHSHGFFIIGKTPDENIGISHCPWCGINCLEKEWSPFDNAKPIIELEKYKAGWVKCPSCQFRFSLGDSGKWDGYRHLRCGQRLKIVSP